MTAIEFVSLHLAINRESGLISDSDHSNLMVWLHDRSYKLSPKLRKMADRLERIIADEAERVAIEADAALARQEAKREYERNKKRKQRLKSQCPQMSPMSPNVPRDNEGQTGTPLAHNAPTHTNGSVRGSIIDIDNINIKNNNIDSISIEGDARGNKPVSVPVNPWNLTYERIMSFRGSAEGLLKKCFGKGPWKKAVAQLSDWGMREALYEFVDTAKKDGCYPKNPAAYFIGFLKRNGVDFGITDSQLAKIKSDNEQAEKMIAQEMSKIPA